MAAYSGSTSWSGVRTCALLPANSATERGMRLMPMSAAINGTAVWRVETARHRTRMNAEVLPQPVDDPGHPGETGNDAWDDPRFRGQLGKVQRFR